MNFRGELGLQFTIHIANQYAVPELVRLAQLGHDKGFQQIWVNDNLTQRNIFVVLAAMAAQVPIKLGTAILVPYFRNPVDIADGLAAISELTEEREFSVGIARGDLAQAGHQIDAQKPLTTVLETVSSVKALLAGEGVAFRDYPQIASYFRLNPEWEFRLGFSPKAPIRFYSGGNGPNILRIAGEIMDGVLVGGFYIPLVRTGRLESLMKLARATAARVQPEKQTFDICELNVSISRDRDCALAFAKPYVTHMLLVLDLMGFTNDDFRTIGIEPKLVKALQESFDGGATVHDAAKLIPGDAVGSCFVVGRPEECRDQIAALMDEAERLAIGQVALAKLGPDYDDAITLLRDEVLPK